MRRFALAAAVVLFAGGALAQSDTPVPPNPIPQSPEAPSPPQGPAPQSPAPQSPAPPTPAPPESAPPTAAGPSDLGIAWEVKNRFRLFRYEQDFLRHVAADHGDGILAAEQRLAADTEGRGWGRTMINSL